MSGPTRIMQMAFAGKDGDPVFEDYVRADIADGLLEALEALLDRDERNTCQHEETHRGGAIWEICNSCGMQWSDDRDPKPEWQDPKEWVKARAIIAKAKGE